MRSAGKCGNYWQTKVAMMLLKLNMGAGEAWQYRLPPIIRGREVRDISPTIL
jgi:hypothetical protein